MRRTELDRPSAAAGASPRWLAWTTLALALAGVAIAGYLTAEHYTASTTLACPDTGTVNCAKVTTSAQSTVLGVPVALLGLLYFVAIAPCCLPAAWRSGNTALRWGRVLLTAAGALFVCYLVYVELFVVDAICLWCTAVHVIAIALFALVAFGAAADPRGQPRSGR